MEEKVVSHYTASGNPASESNGRDLQTKISSALKKAGKDMDSLFLRDLSVIDQLHTGGHLATIDIIKKTKLKPGAEVLDAGCGIGGSSRLIAREFGLKVTGVDIVEDFIKTACFLTDSVSNNENFKYTPEFKQGSVLKLPFKDDMFDGVLSQHTLMNIEDKGLVLNEFSRVLKQGGLLVIHEVVKKSDIPIDLPVPWAASHDISFLCTFEDLRKVCENIGFEVVYHSDMREQTQKWWSKVKAVAGKFSEKPRPLGPHIIFGDNGNKFGSTMLSNVNTGRISVFEAVLKKH